MTDDGAGALWGRAATARSGRCRAAHTTDTSNAPTVQPTKVRHGPTTSTARLFRPAG